MKHHPPSNHRRASCCISVVLLVCLVLQWGLLPCSAETLKEPARADDRLSPAAFADPPMRNRPGCFWAWLNGSITAEQITRDLEAMNQGGMRGGEIWDVAAHAAPDHRMPAGPPFLGPESTRLIVHAIREADRLGLRDKPEARQLLHSLLQYVDSAASAPQATLDADLPRRLFADT
jgi:hypothetical protein